MQFKKMILLLVLVFGVAVLISQTMPTDAAKMNGGKTCGQAMTCVALWKALDLTEDQKQAALSIAQAKREQIKTLKQDTTLTPEAKKAAAKEIIEAGLAEFRQILNADQQQKLDELLLECGKRRAECGGAWQGLQRIRAELNLTPDQEAAITQILAARRDQMQALKADQSLTPAQKKAQFMEIRKAVIAEIRLVLTPDQQQKLAEMLAQWKQSPKK